MPTITINVGKYTKLTKKEFVMQYLFQKGNGNRLVGEATTGEMFTGWVEACAKLLMKPGKVDTLRYEIWKMQKEGVLEVSGTEEGGKAPTPANLYILTEEYHQAMRK